MRIKHYLMLLLLLMSYFNLYSQNAEPFVPARYNDRVRGDILLVGNNILSNHPTVSYNTTGTPSEYNDNVNMVYVDVDSDPTTFSSSSAILQMPNTSRDCYRIHYAALYWSATYKSGDRSNLNRIKFKVPGSSTYTDITGSIIYDEGVGNQLGSSCKPYAAYADVTSLISPFSAEGNYTVANITASTGNNTDCPGGNAGGWSLFVVFEDPKLPGKFITTFDGFTGINGTNTQTIPISGFNTNPTGNVYAKLAFSALEGDNRISGDGMQIRGVNTTPTFSDVTAPSRPTTNFFNSSFTDVNGNYINRTPASQNTLGYDGGVTDVANPGRSVLGNNETQAEVRINTTGDQYYLFFLAFSVEIIEPSVVLTKAVEDNGGRDIGNQNVTLCQELNYRIGFDNIGNDDAEGLNTQPAPYGSDYVLIRDVLPNNVTLVSYDLSNVGGLYDSTTNVGGTRVVVNPTNPRDLSFYVPKRFFTVAETRHEILIKVRVACSCPQLADACSNVIQNQAFITYQGVVSNIVVTNDPSLSQFDPTCLIGVANSTNFLVGIDTCNFTSDVYICGNSVTLTAANNYDSYTWTGPSGAVFTPNNTSQTVSVNLPGTYTVTGNDAQCRPIVQTFNVIQYGSSLTNPIIPYDESPTPVICADNGERLPYIFLCGSTDTQLLQTNISDATSVQWFLYDEATCGAYPPTNCPVTTDSCWTNLVGTGSNYTVTQAGKYRVVFTFAGGCNRTFYFNVYQNLLDPQVVAENIICGNPGTITVNNVPTTGYQFQLLNGATVVFPWQSSNIFTPINTAGNYTVQVRPTAFSGGCVFNVPNIGIQVQDVTVTAQVTQPLCYGQLGEVNLGITGVPGQYYYILHQGPTVASPIVGSAGPTNLTYHVFSGLNPGQTYTWETRTDDGCNRSGTFTINNPTQLNITSSLTKPLTTCGGPGEITVNASGGTPPYYYYLNSAPPAPFLTSNVIPVSTAGTYNITVYDSNNCTATTSINVVNVPDPVYTVSSTNVLCYGANTGSINFNVTNTNGFTLGYSITGGAPFGTNPSFTNLPAGTYTAVVQYTLGSVVCTKSETITINGPAFALTASGGVAAVACDSNGGNGIVRITNVQGGTPYPAPNLYQYNFGSGYQNSNQANLPPGTYTISVRDANLCEYFMTVTLDPIPAPPTINVSAPAFNCNGTATSTVTVNNGASSYTYTYSINPPLVPPHDPTSNVFQNVPCGDSVVTVNYTLVSPPTFSNLLREDFGSGDDTTSPGINPGYCFERQINNPAIYCKGSPQINDGDYSVTKRILFPYGAWYNFLDHTSNGTNPNGRFLAINIGGTAGVGGILYSKPISDIIPNQDIKVSLWAANLLKIDPSNTQSPPDLTVQLVKDLGLPTQAIIASANTGNIPKTNAWNNYQLTLNPGSNTSLSFVIRSNIAVTSGNDVVIDDIEVYQLPVSCLTTRNFPINIPCNQAFTAQVTGHKDVSCAGANDGTITIAAQNYNTTNGYQISMDNGATWITQFTSPVTITVPVGYPGFVLVRYDATPGNSACSFNLPQPIITPQQLLASASATNATCLTGATITASAVGGTPAYQYQLVASPSGTIIAAYQTSNIFTNISPGDYIVNVRDFNGCNAASTMVTIATPVSPDITLASSDLCYDGNGASITVSTTGGNPGYEYNINAGSTWQTSNVFANLAPGSYTIVVRDTYGCTDTLNVVIAPQLTITAALQKDITCSPAPTNAIITGSVNGGTSPTVVMNYTGSGTPPVFSGFPYNTSVAGTYTFTASFTAQDGNTCTAISNAVQVSEPQDPTASHTTVNVSCNGGNDGSVTITPSLGVPPYTITLGATTVTSSTAVTFNNLIQGSYSYTVVDTKGCSYSNVANIIEPLALDETHNNPVLSCNPITNASQSAILTVNGQGGTTPYQYSFNGGAFTTTNTYTINNNGSVQTINFIVRDAKGCQITRSVTVQPLNRPVIASITKSDITCLATTSNVQVNVTAGTGVGVLTYVLSGTASDTNNNGTFNNLSAGSYFVKVIDENGCFAVQSFIIPPVRLINVTGTVLSNVSCNGGSDGSIRFTVTLPATSASYSYTIQNGLGNIVASASGQTNTTIDFTNQPAGTYTINVVDDTTGCTKSFTRTITQPAILTITNVTATRVNCNNAISQITVTRTGGTAAFTFAAVVAGSPMPAFGAFTSTNPLSVDTTLGLVWDVYVKDAKDCIAMRQVTIILDGTPSVTVPSVASNQCTVSTGFTFTATGSGGVTPYTYSLNGAAGPFQTSPTFTVNTPGTYFVTIKDKNGCTATSPTAVTVSPQLTASIVLTKDLTCSIPTNGTIQLNVSGGLAPYEYLLLQNGAPVGSYVPFAGTSATISVSAVANYTVIVRDSNNPRCSVTTNQVTTTAAVQPTVNAVTVDPTCHDGTDGSVTLLASGGTSPYTYSFNGGLFVNSNTFGGLSANVTYTYTVRDSRGCERTSTFTLSNPVPLNVNIISNPILCNANFPGSFDVNVISGGTAPYTYTLLDGSFNTLATYVEASPATTPVHNFPGLAFGFYYIKVVDAKGCEFLSPRLRIETPPNLVLNSNVSTGSCITGAEVEIQVVTGVGPFTYQIYGQPATAFGPTASNVYTFTNLNHGTTYQFQVIDAGGCFTIIEVTTPKLSGIDIDPITTTNVGCNGDNTGSVSFSVINYDPSVTSLSYEVLDQLTNTSLTPAVTGSFTGLTGGAVSTTIPGLSAGSYTLFVKEVDGTECTVSKTFQINQPASQLTATISSEINANCNNGAQVTVLASGGTAPYQYAFVADGVAPAPADYTSNNVGVLDHTITLNWDIWVKDFNGCTFKIDKTITVDPAPTINPVAQQCFTGSTLTFTVTGTAFNGNLVYGINTTNTVPNVFTTTNTFDVTAAGTYYFFVKDDNGCTASTSVVVAPQLQLQATLTQDLTCLIDASVNLVASSGTAPYVTYAVSTTGIAGPFNAIVGTTYTTNIPGSYYFQVTDTQGCTAISNEIIVTSRTSPTFTFEQTNVSCFNGNDGSITITADNGIAPYQYSIDGGITWQTSNVFTNLTEAGVYNVVVKDAKDCPSSIISVDITDPDQLSGTINLIQGLTCGTGNATQAATVEVNGLNGTAPYTYSFDGQVTYSTNNTYTTVLSETVTAYIKDANGCEAGPFSIFVPALNPPTDMEFDSTPITCTNTTSTVTITSVTNGVGPLSYEIISPITVPAQASNQFIGLSPNIPYEFQVTDANGCTYKEIYTIAPVVNISVTGQLLADVSCFGANDGSVEFTIANFSGTYSYSVNGGPLVTGQTSPTITLTGLTGGVTPTTYTVNITDEVTDCTASASVDVTQPTQVTIVVDYNINANCNDLAVVTVQGSGGTPGYTYAAVVNGAPAPGVASYTSNNVFNLDPITSTDWDIYVRDNNGCTSFVDVTITTDTLPVVSLPAFATNQCTSNGTAYTFTAVGNNGVAPYMFSIDGGVSFVGNNTNSYTFTVSSADADPSTPALDPHTVIIKDANDCTSSANITIYPPLVLTFNVDSVVSCANGDGQITLSATGGSGTPNYSYSQTIPAGPTNTNGIFGNLSHSVAYTFTVLDTVTNCTTTVTVTLDEPTPVTIASMPVTDVSCNGGSDGTITVNLAAGNDNTPYTYALIAPSTVTRPAQASNIFTGLPAGSYTVEVVSVRNCRLQQVVTINDPAIIQPTATVTQFACNAGTNSPNLATITVNGVTGGSGTYTTYEFVLGGTVVQSGSSPVYNTSNTAGGSYTINVYDDKNCVGSTIADINPFISISNVPVVTVNNPITCRTNEDITVTVTTTGGVAPTYTYNVTSIPAGTYNVTNTTGVFTGLSIGDYMVTVTNPVTNCSVQAIHYVYDPNTFDVVASGTTNVSCINGNNGSVVLTFVDNLLPDNAGAFSYTITNTTTPLVINGTSANAGPTTPITGLTAGVYSVTATLINAPECIATTNFTILQPSQALDINGSSTPITCNPGNDGTITVQASGGWLGYTYTISPAVGNQTAPGVFENLSPNNYTVTVTDALGCQDTFVVNLVAPQQITGTVNNVQLTCFGVNDGVVTVTGVTGGENIPANYVYTLNYVNPTGASSGPQSSPTFSNLAPGSYTIVINDGLNCQSAPIPFTVLPANEILVTLSKVADSQVCNTSFEQLVLSATGSTGTYQYSTSASGPWTNFVSPLNLGSLPIGQYTYYVRDTNNCAAVASNTVSILQVPALGINPIADIELLCYNYNTTIKAQAFGGEGNYVYSIIPAAGIQSQPGVFTDVPAGSYIIEVASGDCSVERETVNVTSPLEFSYTISPTNTSCSNSNDGSLLVTLSGVDGRQIQYSLTSSDGIYTHNQTFDVADETQPTFTINNLAGNVDYEIRVFTLPHGCIPADQPFRINRPLAVTATVTGISEECAEQDMGEIQITNITGGTAPYSVSYTSNSTVTPGGTSSLVNLGAGVVNHTFQGLDGGDYIVRIIDANNCEFTFDVVLGKGDNYDPIVVVTYPCNPDTNTPMVRIEVQNTLTSNGSFGAGYQFSLDGLAAQNSPIFLSTDPLYTATLSTSGNHTVFVYGPNNCDKIAQPDPLVVTPLQPLSVVLTNPVINTALATVTGGSGNYTYTFYADGRMVQSGTKDNFVYYQQYNEIRVVVTDDSGCTAFDPKSFPYIPICIPDVLTPDGNGENDDWGPGCVDPTVYPRLVTLIYDRYGRLIATLPVGSRWNGKYEGKDLPSGDYWYVVKVDKNDGQEIVGHFTLYR